jgi:thioester reductase-like protein
MLAGVTGSVGSFMLRDLLLDKTVNKVYALVRGKQENLMTRLTEAFQARYLDTSILNSDCLEVLPMCFNELHLGFGKKKYFQLKKEVTIVQHCTWLLDFNMPVDHFDKECIAPFYNLLRFASRKVNPMYVHFVSSVSASALASKTSIVEQPLPFDSHACLPMGYAQSKFAVEMLLNYLTTEKNFPCYIERLGQVCGDSLNNVWNVSEQYLLMFISGDSIMHKMPALDIDVDWITVDYAAATIKDIMLRTSDLPANQNQSIYHIVNSKAVHWNDILQALKDSGMQFETVSFSEWLQ